MKDEDAFLIPTAEVPVTILSRRVLRSRAARRDLPRTSLFQARERSPRKDTRSAARSRFDKVELVRYVTPKQSAQEHELLTRPRRKILKLLELP